MNADIGHLWRREVEKLVKQALEEDLGWGDITTQALIPTGIRGKGIFLSKAKGIIAGLEVCAAVFLQVDSSIVFTSKLKDGEPISPNDTIATVEGNVHSILKAERVSLNFLQRLSGIATETRAYVDAVKGLPVKIIDTRKTTPGLRSLDKYAVTIGGGFNHRMHLGDGILIKDNHLAIMYNQGFTLKEIINLAKKNAPHTLKIEVEVKDYQEAMEAFKAGADILLLDNMDVETTSRVVKEVKGKTLTEASGGIRLTDVHAIGQTGVDSISIGAITHSAGALDISLEIEAIS